MKLLCLKSGPLSMLFDPGTAFLRHIKLGDVEIVRGVFAAVRDRDWNTVPFVIDDLEISRGESQFQISLAASCQSEAINFQWQGVLSGSPTGTVEYRFTGTAGSTFWKNRIGLCVLHPLEGCAGGPCVVEHLDGSVTQGVFPKWVSPHQPFKNIAAISHPVSPDLLAQVSFRGEAFEMEDQRNWTDASFKTYSTPLELPFPVEVAPGTTIEHTVTIALMPSNGRTHKSTSQNVPAARLRPIDRIGSSQPRLSIDKFAARVRPSIGLLMSTSQRPLHEQAIARLRELAPDHLRVDLRLSDTRWQNRAADAVELIEQIGAQLEVAIFTEQLAGSSWDECLRMLQSLAHRLARVLIFHTTAKTTPARWGEEVSRSLREHNLSARWVVGTDAYFAELNRQRLPVPAGGAVCYSINPQVHAFDNRSICETFAGQRATVETAHEIFAANVVVSPITLKPRFNPNSTSATAIGSDENLPGTDDRQTTGFAAAWCVGALNALATHPAVESLTFFEAYGERGIIDESGKAYPVLDTLAWALRATAVMPTLSSHPLDLAAIAIVTKDNRNLVLVANLSDHEQTVCIDDGERMQQSDLLAAHSVNAIEWEHPQ